MTDDQCRECAAGGHTRKRAIVPNSGGRCATHWRAEKLRRKRAAHARRIERTYGITGEQYDLLYDFQGGTCAICQRATGLTRQLSVDHDHATGYVRGLLCRPCNDMLGHARDSQGFFARAMRYLQSPPAHHSIGQVRKDG